ncbi:succinate dehydrogenase, cytochrome b556 subunit [Caldichromatium japonicum]|uniref:Succinate dehydrogenase cytochrome b556 subunit n=1 Tax=Caldichromatium japonicum TaxID=2699430 RepID=A0A6G7VEA8_9GAMM|nr:succinate dehydrogenase, cytochrome b556 subunit [Caldichromatium japonicum]QIK38188.1 succinate dehydrogenase, cytochrome b556 subunit [Caldichromatium japonicum]
MASRRPIFLDLFVIRLPPAALVSILHRVSGALLVLAIPWLAWLMGRALSGPEGFAEVASILDHWVARPILVLVLWAPVHHLLAGLRHLALDLGLGLERTAAQATARLTLLGAAGVVVLLVLLLRVLA